jgi:hypothetical protein
MSQVVCLDQPLPHAKPRDLVVKRLAWDWNDLSEIVSKELLGITQTEIEGCFYLNPMFKVLSPEATPEFLLEVRKRQGQWFRILGRQFRSSNVRRTMAVTRDVCERRLTLTGVLFVHGEDIDPKQQRQLEVMAGLRPASHRKIVRRQASSNRERQ